MQHFPSRLLKISRRDPLLKHPWFKSNERCELYYSERYHTHAMYETATGQWLFMPYPKHKFRSSQWNKARLRCLLSCRDSYLKHVRNPLWADLATKYYICSVYKGLPTNE